MILLHHLEELALSFQKNLKITVIGHSELKVWPFKLSLHVSSCLHCMCQCVYNSWPCFVCACNVDTLLQSKQSILFVYNKQSICCTEECL